MFNERVFRVDDIDEVAAAPGLYAWYGLPPDSPLDLETPAGTREWLAGATRRVEEPALNSEATGRLSAKWRGTLADTSLSFLLESIDSQNDIQEEPTVEATEDDVVSDTPGRRTALQHTLADDGFRLIMASILRSAAPALASPIYVGMSTNLSTRLSRHRKDIFRFYEALEGDESVRERFRVHARFGARAVGYGFSSETLLVLVREVPELSGLPIEDCRRLLLSAEWFLNRWYRPLLGKR